MALHLKARPGDAQALKCYITAALAKKTLKIDAAASHNFSNLFGTPSICLTADDGVFTEPNAAAAYILGWCWVFTTYVLSETSAMVVAGGSW